MSSEVTRNVELSRFEIRQDGQLAGRLDYVVADGRMNTTHTVVDPQWEGGGLGGQLVAAALAAARDEGRSVVPTCSFVRHYIDLHPEYADLVA